MRKIKRILIDATSLIRKTTGIEYYTFQIVKNLLKYDDGNKYIILFKESVPEELRIFEGKAKFIICSSKSQIYCEQIWIPRIIRNEKPDVVHFPAFPPGLLVFHKNIIFTLHDATMWKFKETTSWKNKVYMKPLSELAVRKAKYIFTVSLDSKKNIDAVFPKYRNKVVVTRESISDKFKIISDTNDIENVKKKFNIDSKYILSVCSLEPRKNIPKLLESYYHLLFKYKNHGAKLVLVGRKAWGNNLINEVIEKFGLEKDVIITDYVSDRDLINLYNGASCFIYPSLYEGFGLPILEAMACGIPVITSNNSSIPEVAADAAILINPNAEMEIAEAINKVLEDSNLRKDMIEKGFTRVKSFSWINIVNNMKQYYREV
ncbi:glycosyltransferase family 4 protein [Clostridium polynesiense]|uniref:glycosyltransferase family 4 protein n=1 Tax=Clostridium polynesiense TaxID=1325933 RepID=UPI00058E6B4C|nr:glycosyltransferase family 1 protein [Clostridium polynesiense]